MPAPSTVFIATNDLSGLTRGRAVPAAALSDVLESGVGWVPADLALTSSGSIAPNVFGSTGDLRLLPDRETAAELPARNEHPGVTLMLADQVEPDGTPWRCCARAFARQALQALRQTTGLRVRASFEHEFMLPDLAPTAPFSFARHREAEPFGSTLVDLLQSVGLEPENWLPEFGAEQFEITLRPVDALAAADRAILLREIVRELGRQHRQRVTFAPLTHPGGSGNGVHVHLSLRDDHGRPALYDSARPAGLSVTGAQFAAGILAHARGLMAFTAPSPVSYLRLSPHRWSVGGVFMAERNREALLRICPTNGLSGEDPGPQYNLEFRATDATANPWLVIGVLVKAGLEGIKNQYELPTIWPESVTDAELEGVPRLPASLAEALASLRSDGLVTSWFDDDLLATQLAVKEAEIEMARDLGQDELCRRAADVY